MKLLLDTIYFLPAIGVSVKGVPEDTVLKLRNRGHTTSVCMITIFELAAKGGKYIAAGRLKLERVLRGLRAVTADEELVKVPYEEEGVLSSALRLREVLADFTDCLILSAALHHCDGLVTEDGEMLDSLRKERVREIIRPFKAEFRVFTSKELLKEEQP